MPEFQLPSGAPGVLDNVELLNVSFDVEVPTELIPRVRTFLKGESAVHVGQRRRVTLGTSSVELWAIIGVHSDPRENRAADTYLHGHVRLDRRPARADETCTKTAWNRAVRLLLGVMGECPANVNLRLGLPSEGAVTAVTLPIEFSPGDVPGFSDIRGVQLVQSDSDNLAEPLYSVILQQTPRRLSVDIKTSVSLALHASTLSDAFTRAMDIARLAVPSLEAR